MAARPRDAPARQAGGRCTSCRPSSPSSSPPSPCSPSSIAAMPAWCWRGARRCSRSAPTDRLLSRNRAVFPVILWQVYFVLGLLAGARIRAGNARSSRAGAHALVAAATLVLAAWAYHGHHVAPGWAAVREPLHLHVRRFPPKRLLRLRRVPALPPDVLRALSPRQDRAQPPAPAHLRDHGQAQPGGVRHPRLFRQDGGGVSVRCRCRRWFWASPWPMSPPPLSSCIIAERRAALAPRGRQRSGAATNAAVRGTSFRRW